MIPMCEPVEGQYGHAEPVELPDTLQAAETVCYWCITSPVWHPAWSQYSLTVVRLRDNQPGFPPPYHKFEGTTHELLVVALNPHAGPQTAETLHATFVAGRSVSFLTPVNIAEQYIATDEEMRDLASLCAQAVIAGALNPETSNGPTAIREQWLSVTVRTLAHIRGEEHAS